jgi:hypothetical protein
VLACIRHSGRLVLPVSRSVHARAAGKSDVAARTFWQITYLNVSFRCVRRPDGAGYVLGVKHGRSGWQATAQSDSDPWVLYRYASSRLAELVAT